MGRNASLPLPALLALLAGPAAGEWQGPLFDGHIHYSADARESLPPEQALATLARAGIALALVSSTPDAGSLALAARDPQRVAACLRPYRSPADRGGWHKDPGVLDHVRRTAAAHPFVCLGELHLHGDEARHPRVAEYLSIAADRGWFVHVHSGPEVVHTLLATEPRLRVLWAHAGMSTPPAGVRAVLEASDRVWVELSYRYDEVAPGGALDAEWGALLRGFPARFVLGTDTWAPSRWDQVEPLARHARRFLAALPESVARRIAFENGAALVGR